ncbi:unnamed protein product [Ostreobium quekettii]|uniref:Delta(14)-sterol reductase ERG24 n=1 Tax=Ostreobium quekettii TaxID=121088 RepID=A0A8S1J336_9CHLO|nr:unnamed protein product [Ostreobium quekettii]
MAKEHEFEFFGPWLGPLGIVFGLPFVCYAAAVGSALGRLPDVPTIMGAVAKGWRPTLGTVAALAGWMAVTACLHVALPGQICEGAVLASGKRLTYKLNGFRLLMLVYPTIFYLAFFTPYLDLAWVHDHWLSILSTSILLSFALSLALYIASRREGTLLATGGQTGHLFYDFFIGAELNPRIGSFDLKEFCELYPGLIGWAIINLAMAHKQLQVLGRVTNSMVLVNAFQLLYVVDGLWFERSILTTMDITTDGFGFMLVFGDLTWVPFIYSLQARYLASNPQDLSLTYSALVMALNVLGYAAFRGANSQKDQFRRDPQGPSVRHLKTLKTESGRQLIVSSWWGTARHINYTGDWLMGLAWCMACGFSSIVPYFYAVYFATLLVHRDIRDGQNCQLKYGSDWKKYCSIVPYRFIPYVY